MRFLGYDIKKRRQPNYPYTVGLALGGGGARGFAHAGAIEALLEVGLRPQILAGVSAGSVVAVMHAAGIAPKQMLKLFEKLKFSSLTSLGMPKGGLFGLEKFQDFLHKNIPYDRLEQLPVPTVVCATDFEKGRKVAFTEGPLPEVVAASCCIPIAFKPIEIDGVRYVDGGVLANLPCWAIRDKCRFLMAVNVSPLIERPVANTLIDMSMRSYELITKNNTTDDMAMADMLICTNDIAQYKVFDLKGIKEVYRSGYRDTMRNLQSRGIDTARRQAQKKS